MKQIRRRKGKQIVSKDSQIWSTSFAENGGQILGQARTESSLPDTESRGML